MIDPSQIREHMEVVGSDGEHVGTVDGLGPGDTVKLTRTDEAAGGEHHMIPLEWVASVDQVVRLNLTGAHARERWHAEGSALDELQPGSSTLGP